ncbi:MAG: choice-of-anchor J domain-containing protein [Muribaculaceae bacterium]|nr:choice-of-anchor J domain-containing protein [Muribaculaceae bacterium]
MKTRSITMFSALALSMWAVTASGAAPKIVPFHFTHGGFVSSVSPDGLWAVGVPRTGDPCNQTQIVDLTTGELITLPVNSIIDQEGEEIKPMEGTEYYTSAVSADGKLIAGSVDGEPGVWKEGVWTMLDFPNGRRKPYSGYYAEISSVKGNGKYITGMAYNDAFNILPLFWEDGVLMSTDDMKGLPDSDWLGNTLGEGNCTMRFYTVSNDGNILIGGMSTNVGADGCCFFAYDREKGEYNYIGTDYLLENMKSGKISPASEVDGTVTPILSENGKYLVGNILLVYDPNSEYGRDTYLPFLYNVETKEFKVFEGEQHEDMIILGVTNDGHILGSSPHSSPNRTVMFLSDNEQWYSLENILEQVYGMNFINDSGYDCLSGTAFGISTDGKVLTAMTPGAVNDGYNIFLDDESFFDATKKVNLLYSNQVSPLANSQIAILDKVYVRFEYPSTPVAMDAVEIRDKDGKVVAKSESIDVYRNDNRIYEISFDPTSLNAGERYNVVIPAGTFTIEEVGHKNNEITVSYIGRENKPVSVESVSPQAGSAMNEIGSTNMVCLTFDGTVQPVTGKVGYLYQEGQESALTTLQLVSYNNLVYVYPAASRKLMFGTKYKIVIPAGSIVDLTGYCPNEAIELEYAGAYEVPAPDAYSDYLFYEDFNNMSESLAHMLRYEGDHLEPVGEMLVWEFDADNQPWNFSVRDNASVADFSAASHSMYINKGKSDDWMTTPQLRLENGNEHYVLNFQAQNYRKDKNDYLKVLVWECDEVLQELDKDIVDRMRNEGKVIFNEKLTPGNSEDALEKDWTDYSCDLDGYKGKNIYIAFVNENENQSVIFVDNINVVKKSNYRAGFIMPETVKAATEVETVAFVEVTSDNAYNNLTAVLKDNKGKEVAKYEAKDLKLNNESGLYKFTFSTPLPLEAGEVNNYSMDVKLDDEEMTVTGKLSHLLFETTKRVVLEEVTGAWCGNCPAGIVAIEYLEGTVGENFIPVSIHNGDNYAWLEYEQFLGFSAYPTGKINRINEILSPLSGEYDFTTEAGNETFTDYVLKELEIPAVADIEILNAEFDGDQTVNVETAVTFAMNAEQANYNIFTLLVEDNLSGRQANYFVGRTEPIFADWADKKSHVNVLYKDVARSKSGGSFHGENGYIPTEVKAGEAYKANIKLPVTEDVKSLGSCKVICMLVDAGTGEIKNAYRLNEIGVGDTAVDEIIGDVKPVVEVVAGAIYVNGSDENVEVYNLQGAHVANRDLAKGIYIVRSIVNGKAVTAKVMVR